MQLTKHNISVETLICPVDVILLTLENAMCNKESGICIIDIQQDDVASVCAAGAGGGGGGGGAV